MSGELSEEHRRQAANRIAAALADPDEPPVAGYRIDIELLNVEHAGQMSRDEVLRAFSRFPGNWLTFRGLVNRGVIGRPRNMSMQELVEAARKVDE